MSDPQAKEPARARKAGAWRKTNDVLRGSRWESAPLGLSAVSTVDVTRLGPEWHVSVARLPGPLGDRTPLAELRATDEEVARARRAFGMAEAHEDNHGPRKFTRSLWLAVDPALRKDCDCFDEPPEHHPIPGGGTYVWRDEGAARSGQ